MSCQQATTSRQAEPSSKAEGTGLMANKVGKQVGCGGATWEAMEGPRQEHGRPAQEQHFVRGPGGV